MGSLILILIAILYTISPIDFMPGPIDDAIFDLVIAVIVKLRDEL